MRTVTVTTGRPKSDPRSGLLIGLTELHTLQVFAATRLDLAVTRARELLASPPVATAAALELADLLRVAASAAARSAIAAQGLRRDLATAFASAREAEPRPSP